MSHVAAFLGIAAAVIVVPGPDTALTVRNTLAGGRGHGLATALGVSTGLLVTSCHKHRDAAAAIVTAS